MSRDKLYTLDELCVLLDDLIFKTVKPFIEQIQGEIRNPEGTISNLKYIQGQLDGMKMFVHAAKENLREDDNG